MSAQPIRPLWLSTTCSSWIGSSVGATRASSGRRRRACPRASRRAGSGPRRSRCRPRRTPACRAARSSALAAAPGRIHLQERELDELAAVPSPIECGGCAESRAVCWRWPRSCSAAAPAAASAERGADRVHPHPARADGRCCSTAGAARLARTASRARARRLRPAADAARHEPGRADREPRLRPRR